MFPINNFCKIKLIKSKSLSCLIIYGLLNVNSHLFSISVSYNPHFVDFFS